MMTPPEDTSTYEKLRTRYYWRKIFSDVNHWCRSCCDCAMRKSPSPFSDNVAQSIDMVGGSLCPTALLNLLIVGVLCSKNLH